LAISTTRRSVLLPLALTLAACASTPTALPIADHRVEGTVSQIDEAMEIARAMAGREMTSTTPEMDALTSLVASTTPDLGLRDLLAEQPPGLAPAQLSAGDTISVLVFGRSEFSGEHVVAQDGTIRVPILGPVAAGGLTPSGLAREIRIALLSTYLRRAEVTVRVVKRSRRIVTLFGAVQAPIIAGAVQAAVFGELFSQGRRGVQAQMG
jgi:hypothetical protein